MEAIAPDRQLAGRYTLVEQIGAGGMATVWRAQDSVLARVVAVKVLREHLAADAALLERFRREAAAAARIAHPNVVRVYDAGTDGGHAFIVMEYVAGNTLRDVIERAGALDPAAAAGVIVAVLSGLARAHAAGIVHRDVRPGNILIAAGGLVKVTDFGLAAAAASRGDLETTREMLGTLGYVAPEQVQGGDVTPATDVYATGLVLDELLTGRPAYHGSNDLATAMERLTTPVTPPSAMRPGIPRAMDQVVARATALRPRDRYPTADAMRAALERFAAHGAPLPSSTPVDRAEPPVAPARSNLRGWMLVPLIVVLVAAAVIAGGLALGRLSLGGPLGIQAAPEASTAPPTGTAEITQLAIAGARDEDPQGPDGGEHHDAVGRAVDGDTATSWTTDHYRTEAFGNLKTGVGLWIELRGSADVHTVTVTSPLAGWTFELYPTSSPAGAPIASVDGETTFTATRGTVTVDVRPLPTNGVLIWITRLAPDGEGYAAAIAEVSLRGLS
jgi:serine/threonine-protein kinase